MVCSAASFRPVDVWAIGCTIAFMATGKPLLMGSTVRDQIEEVIMKVGKCTPPPFIISVTIYCYNPLQVDSKITYTGSWPTFAVFEMSYNKRD